MRYFVARRVKNIAATGFVVAGLYWMWQRQVATLQDDGFTTGYVLYFAMLFLAAYGIRKKISVIPLGRASVWFQAHLYVGVASGFVFLMHVGMRWPNGLLETALAGTYCALLGSGLFGLYLTRSVPRKLTRLPEEYVLERIPALRHDVACQARRIALATAGAEKSDIVARFYADELSFFFDAPRELWFYVFPGSLRRRRLMRRLTNVQRYCSEQERNASESLFDLIRKKDDLDYHYALQLMLRSWLFVHVGLTYSLLITATLHLVLVHAFYGAT